MRTPVKLFQSKLTAEATVVYTCPASKRAQLVELWIVNTNTKAERKISLYAHGSQPDNAILIDLPIEASKAKMVSECKIILKAGETFACKGEDILVTAYGVEEDV